MPKERKLNPWYRFMLLVCAPAFASFISIIQLWDDYPIVHKTGAWLWWITSIGFGIIAIYELIIVIKDSGGSSNMVK